MLLSTLLTTAGLATVALAVPLEARDYQTVHLTFEGGPASYSMAIPADGNTYPTNNDLSVSIIDDNDFDAYSACTFTTAGQVTLMQTASITTGNQSILVGPPQPIISVSCSGTCIPVYGDCYNYQDQPLGVCCNGYCAATKCRPWNDV